MQEAVPAGEGAMAAILGLSPADVAEVCKKAAEKEVVAPANLNSPEQTVISGSAVGGEARGRDCVAVGREASSHSAGFGSLSLRDADDPRSGGWNPICAPQNLASFVFR